MVSFDHSHRPAPSAHKNRVRSRGVSSYTHAAQKRRVTHASCAKNNVIPIREVCCVENSLQFFRKSLLDHLCQFFIVPRPHHSLDIAAKTSDRGGCQHCLGRPSYADV